MLAHWIAVNWFNLVQTVALIATLSVAVSALRSSNHATKGANRLAVAAANRDIWQQVITNPALKRVLRPTMAEGDKVTDAERRFVLQVFQHSGAVFATLQMGAMDRLQGYRRDVHDTMQLPVFQIVWNEFRTYQDIAFVRFVDSCIAGVNLDASVGKTSSLRILSLKVRPARSVKSILGRRSKPPVLRP